MSGRPNSSKIFFSVAVLLCVGLKPDLAMAANPNIVIILADDLGYGDLGCYGGKISTPQIDRLAKSGLRFTDAHTSSSVCSPTRYGLLTGRYNWRSKLKQGVLGGLSPRMIEPGRMTIASMLKNNGYRTACIGKWHLGMDWVKQAGKVVSELNIESREQVFNVDYSQPISNGPNSVGFDYYFGISASLDMVPYTFIENDRVLALPTADRDFLMMHERPDGPKTRLGPAAPDFEARDVLPTLTRKAIEFIEGSANDASSGKPFFLYLPLASPHTPILPTEPWIGKSGMNAYADFVMQTDDSIGQVAAAIDRNQLAENTLFVVTSDNGCSPQAKFDELIDKGHNPSGALRGHKADIFEGGHRVPMIVRWPKQIKPSRVCSDLVCLNDWMATLAEVVQYKLPDSAGEDSFSFLPELLDDMQVRKTPKRDHLVSHSINGSFAVRQSQWKLALCRDSGGWSQPRPGLKQNVSLPEVQLYDLENDLAETNNQAEANPERVRVLTEFLEKIVAEGRSTAGTPQANTGSVNIRHGMQIRN